MYRKSGKHMRERSWDYWHILLPLCQTLIALFRWTAVRRPSTPRVYGLRHEECQSGRDFARFLATSDCTESRSAISGTTHHQHYGRLHKPGRRHSATDTADIALAHNQLPRSPRTTLGRCTFMTSPAVIHELTPGSGIATLLQVTGVPNRRSIVNGGRHPATIGDVRRRQSCGRGPPRRAHERGQDRSHAPERCNDQARPLGPRRLCSLRGFMPARKLGDATLPEARLVTKDVRIRADRECVDELSRPVSQSTSSRVTRELYKLLIHPSIQSSCFYCNTTCARSYISRSPTDQISLSRCVAPESSSCC